MSDLTKEILENAFVLLIITKKDFISTHLQTDAMRQMILKWVMAQPR